MPPADLAIRAAEPTDLADFHAILATPSVLRTLVDIPTLTRAEVERAYFNPTDRSKHVLVGVLDGRVVAHAGLVQSQRPRQRHVGRFFVAVADAHQGRGVGRAITIAALDLADRYLGLVRVELEVNADNARAIGLYQSVGFEREGVLRANVLRDGELVDSWAMARIRAAPKWNPTPT